MQSDEYNKLPLELRKQIYQIYSQEIELNSNPHFQTGMTYILNLLFGFQNYSYKPIDDVKTFICDGYVSGVTPEGNISFYPEFDDKSPAKLKQDIIDTLSNLNKPAKCRIAVTIETNGG